MKQYDKPYQLQNSEDLFQSTAGLHRFIKNLLLKNYRITESRQRHGELIPYHSHDRKEIILVIEGAMRLIVEEDIIDLKQGDMITIEPWAIHLAAFPEEGGAIFYLGFPAKKAGS